MHNTYEKYRLHACGLTSHISCCELWQKCVPSLLPSFEWGGSGCKEEAPKYSAITSSRNSGSQTQGIPFLDLHSSSRLKRLQPSLCFSDALPIAKARSTNAQSTNARSANKLFIDDVIISYSNGAPPSQVQLELNRTLEFNVYNLKTVLTVCNHKLSGLQSRLTVHASVHLY